MARVRPDQVGTWTIKFKFPGGYYPAGNYTADPGAVMEFRCL